MTTMIDDKLYTLQRVCNRYLATDPLADWVLFAATRYINTGRATRAFIQMFINYPDDKLLDLVKYCLNGDRSDDGIIKSMAKKLRKP